LSVISAEKRQKLADRMDAMKPRYGVPIAPFSSSGTDAQHGLGKDRLFRTRTDIRAKNMTQSEDWLMQETPYSGY